MGEQTAMGPPLTALQYDLVYNMISFGLASMMASTVFFFLRLSSFAERYKAALCFTGLVTLIAMYHYMRIFNSFEASYTPCEVTNGEVNPNKCDPAKYGYTATGIAFNDAYRYVDWLLTVPLLLIEIVLVMKLSESETFSRCCTLGVSSALMMHIPCRLHLPNACRILQWQGWSLCSSHGRNPGRIHCVRCDLQVWCWLPRVPHWSRQVHDGEGRIRGGC